ncbi:MAG: PAS domain S-box protein [Anaerolineae bacterium]|nr:PAS domain S-box protein [Anaerolineae bacterium]
MTSNMTKAQLMEELRIDRQRIAELERVSVPAGGEALFSLVFQVSPSWMILTEFDTGKYVEVNEAFLNTLGYKHEEVIGKTSAELNIFVDSNQRAILFERLQRQGYLRDEFVSVHTKAGEIRYGMLTGELIQVQKQKFILIGVNDITSRKQEEDELHLVESRYRALIENAPDGIVLIGTDFKFKYASPSAEKIFGYDLNTDFELSPDVLTHPDDLPMVLGVLSDLLEHPERTPTIQYRFLHKDGDWRWIESTFSNLLALPSVEALVINFRDITERKQTEMALQASEENYRKLAETSDSAIAVLDWEGRILYANPISLRIWQEPQFVGKTIHDLFTKEIADGYLAVVRRVIDEHLTDTNELEATIKGRSMWFHATMSPLKNSDGSVDTLLFNAMDITARKRAEVLLVEAQRIGRIGYMEWNIDKEYLTCSEELYEIFGLPLSTPMTQATVATMLASGESYRLRQLDAEAFALRSDVNYEFCIYLPDGQKRHLHQHGKLTYNEAGAPIRMMAIIQDITERKETEEALRQSEERLRLSLSATNLGMYDLNVQTGEAVVNREYALMLGYDPDTFVETNQAWLERTHPDDRDRTAQVFIDYTSGILPEYRVEFRQRTHDGQWKWILSLGKVLEYDDTGKPLRMLGTHIDITEPKRNEALILAQRDLAHAVGRFKTAEEGYRVCLETVLELTGFDSGGIYLFSPDYTSLDLVYHYGLSDSFIQTVSRFSMDSRNVQRILPGVPIYFSKDDSILQIEYHRIEGLRSLGVIPILYQEQVIGCLNLASHTLSDVHEYSIQMLEALTREIGNFAVYLRAQEALRTSEENFRLIAETINEVFWMADLETQQILYVSPAFERTLKVLRKDLKPGANPFFEYIIPEDQEKIAYIKGLQKAGQPFNVEYRIQRVDELILTIWDRGYPVKGPNGKVIYVGVSQNITDRKQSEQFLIESEERYRLLSAELEERVLQRTAEVKDLYDKAPTGYYSLDAAGCYVNINQTVLNWLGYTQEEMLGRSFKEFITSESIESFKQNFPNFKKIGYVHDIEFEFIRKDSSTFLALVNATASYDEHGNYLTSRSTVIDITQRKKTELALRESEETYRALFESANDAIFIISPESGSILSCNPRCIEVLGWLPEELIGQRPEEFIVFEELNDADSKIQDLLNGKRIPVYERKFISKEGGFIETEINLSLIRDGLGQPKYIQSVVRNISARKQAENALRESEEQNRLLFEESPEAVVLFDDAGRVMRVNHAFENVTGVVGDTFIGHLVTEIGLLPSDLMNALAISVEEEFLKESPYASLEFKLKHASGEMRDISTRVFALNVHGKPQYLASMHDVTTNKHAEETLRLANAEMERSLRLKDEFLANMSHELRTPLNAILGISESLLEQISGPVNEKQNRYLQTILESAQHLLELINDILDLAKINAGRVDLDLNKTDIQMVANASLRMIRELAQKKSVGVEFEIDETVTQAWVDERRLKQMLVNLLSNAVKFTPKFGKIGLEVRADPQDGILTFTIWDTGIGIAEKDLRLLFQPFIQLDAGFSRSSQGTGLGLVLVSQMARLHGGSVSVESTPGKGSRFSISLPWIVTEENMPPISLITKESTPLPQNNDRSIILLVEDTVEVTMLINDYLESHGYAVMTAKDGYEAIARVKEKQPDLILMDVMMPELDGLETTRRLRSDLDMAEVPIIALTALAMAGDRERCLEAGMNDYLSKPVRLKELLITIEKHLHQGGLDE